MARARVGRVLQVSAVVVVAGVVLAGCASGGGSAAGSSGAPVTLRVQTDSTASNVQMAQAIADGFEQLHPNVTVKLESVSDAASISTELSGSNPPDIGLMQLNATQFAPLADNGDLLDLAKVWKAADLSKRYSPQINASAKYKGKYYALSTNVLYYSFLYYNADMFKRDGIKVPADHRITSDAQLYQISAALTKGGAAPLEVAGGTGYEPAWMISALLPSASTPAQMSNLLTNYQPSVPVTTKYTDAPFVKTLQALSDYNKNGVFPAGFLGVTDATQNEAAFQSGQAGMILDGVWYDATLKAAKLGFKYNWLLLPPVKAGNKTQLPVLFNPSVVIPSHGKHLALAQEYAEYMVSDAAQEKAIIQVGNAIPSVNSIPASAYTSLSPVVRQMIADVNKNGEQPGWTSTVPGSIGQQFSNPLVQGVWSGSETPKSAAAKVQQALIATRSK
jgi:ABC-type glycerol-3-phosphate transport system substrate-binding protein